MVAARILVVLGCLYSVISNIAHVKVKAWPWSTPTDVYPVPPPRSAAAQTVDATLAAVAPPAADFFGGRAKRVWPSCTDGAGDIWMDWLGLHVDLHFMCPFVLPAYCTLLRRGCGRHQRAREA